MNAYDEIFKYNEQRRHHMRLNKTTHDRKTYSNFVDIENPYNHTTDNNFVDIEIPHDHKTHGNLVDVNNKHNRKTYSNFVDILPDNHNEEVIGKITPADVQALTIEDRKILLEKRLVQLQQNEQTIAEITQKINHPKPKQSSSGTDPAYEQSVQRVHAWNTDIYSNKSVASTALPVFPDSDYERSSPPTDLNPYMKHTKDIIPRNGSRTHRSSVLAKAEQLLKDRKQKIIGSVSEDEPHKPRQRKQERDVRDHKKPRHHGAPRGKTYTIPRSLSPPSDTEYSEVPETIESDDASSDVTYSHFRESRRSYVPSSVKSEIPTLHHSDDDNGFNGNRPSTVNGRKKYSEFRRYEGDGDYVRSNFRDVAHKRVGPNTGALVYIFINNEPHFKGIPFTVTSTFKTMKPALEEIDKKIQRKLQVKRIFKWPEGREIKSVGDFQNRCVYVVSFGEKLRRDIRYGDMAGWVYTKPSEDKIRPDEIILFKKAMSPKGSPKTSPYLVNVVHNRNRSMKEMLILNPNTNQSFEKFLETINYLGNPVKSLYVDKPPYDEIRSFSKLFRELQNRSCFIACGDELEPYELTKKRQAPSSNSSTESMTENRGRKNKLSKQQDTSSEQGRPDTASSRYDSGPRPQQSQPPPHQRQVISEIRRKDRGCVEIAIDGRIHEFWPPSYYDSDDDGVRPNQLLKVDWVYGFRGRDARHNLALLPETEELVYYVASIVVIFDKFQEKQRYYTQHNEEISCLTLHPKGKLIATGQLHGKTTEHSSHIRLWDHKTLSTQSVIGVGVFYGGIISIAFSPGMDGRLMCVLDGSAKHVLSVWKVRLEKDPRGDDSNSYIIARTSTTTDSVHGACFYPFDDNNSILITYGAKHIYFWKIFFDSIRRGEAKIMRDRNSGIFEDCNFADHLIEHRPRSVNCLAFLKNGDVVTGDSSGNLMVWDRDAADAFTCKYVTQAHEGPVMSVLVLSDGALLSGAGNEIKVWDLMFNFECIMIKNFPQEYGGVRSIVTRAEEGDRRAIVNQTEEDDEPGGLFIGTTQSCILEGNLYDRFNVLVEGHSDGIYGIVPHPEGPTFFTAGTDAVVSKWSANAHRVYWRAKIDYPCASLAVDGVNEILALGTVNGMFFILNAFNGICITSVQVGVEPISCLAFSRDGNSLAVGCNDGLITIFEIQDKGHKFKKKQPALRGHASGIAHLDWSRDGNSLQTVGHDNALLFWDLLNMKQNEMPQKTRDIEWHTHTCNVQYALIGPWTNLKKGEQITHVSRTKRQDLLLVGDSSGRLRLYKFPCSREGADFRQVRVYSSEVTGCAFTPDGRGAITCGGHNAALIQWSVAVD